MQKIESLGRITGVILAGAMAVLMVNLDGSVVTIVLPELCEQFGMRADQASLVVLSYLLALTGTSLIFGRLSDMKGPEPVFISGYLIFSAGSGLCALAWDLYSLSVFRLVQGLGGAMIFATSAVIVMRYLPEEVRGRAFAVNGMLAGLGFALGSPVGGFLSHHFGWRMVFLVNIPIGMIGLGLCVCFLKLRNRQEKQDHTFDKTGAVLSMLTLTALVVTLHSLSGETLLKADTLLGVAVAALLGVVFVRVELRKPNPLINMRIFNNAGLNMALAGIACYYVILQGITMIFPFYLIQTRGLSEIQAGNLLFAGPIITIVLAPLAGWLSDRVGPRIPCMIGAVLFVVTGLIFMQFDASTPVRGLLGGLMLFGMAASFYSSPILTLIMSHARPDTLGIISSIKAVAPMIVGMTGVGVYAAVYSHAHHAAAGTRGAAGLHAVMYLSTAVAAVCLIVTFRTRPATSENRIAAREAASGT